MDGDTPLHAAAENGHVECCKFILQHVKDKNPRNLAGKTPAQMASVKIYVKVKGLKRLTPRQGEVSSLNVFSRLSSAHHLRPPMSRETEKLKMALATPR